METYSLNFLEANILNIGKPNNTNTASMSRLEAPVNPKLFSNFPKFCKAFLCVLIKTVGTSIELIICPPLDIEPIS